MLPALVQLEEENTLKTHSEVLVIVLSLHAELHDKSHCFHLQMKYNFSLYNYNQYLMIGF